MRAFLCEQNMDWMVEKITNFYSKKKGRRRVKINERWRDREIVRLEYRVVGDKKVKVSKCWRMCNCKVAN